MTRKSTRTPPASRPAGFAPLSALTTPAGFTLPIALLRIAGATLALVALVALPACAGTTPAEDAEARPGPRTVQPGAPGTVGQDLSASPGTMAARHAHTEADVLFVRNMIHHHAQAVEMSRMVPDRTNRTDVLLLARRIDRSQEDEIAFMTNWLRLRGEEVPEVALELTAHGDHGDHDTGARHDRADMDHHDHADHADHDAGAHHDHHDHGETLMAGMLSPERMDELAAARGEDFDRLFIESMIYHHEGALDMVEELFSTRGAAQDTELFQFASHVDADQRIEIGRMYRMLDSVPGG